MVYSNYELAVDEAREKVEEYECDLFLCKVCYPSGVEYVLKPCLNDGFSYIEKYSLSISHKFTSEKKARAAADRLMKSGREQLGVRAVYKRVNGYNFISHFKIIEI